MVRPTVPDTAVLTIPSLTLWLLFEHTTAQNFSGFLLANSCHPNRFFNELSLSFSHLLLLDRLKDQIPTCFNFKLPRTAWKNKASTFLWGAMGYGTHRCLLPDTNLVAPSTPLLRASPPRRAAGHWPHTSPYCRCNNL